MAFDSAGNLMRMCGSGRKEASGPIAEEDEPARIS